MFPILVTLFLSAALGASPARNPARIINGQIASVGEFPYQVSIRLRDGGMHFCGGSIINQNTILTAAHCVSSRTPDLITVVAGTTRLDGSGDFYDVSRIINHENWTDYNILNDIALLKLSRPITFSNLVGVISVASEEVAPNTDAIISGWGVTDPNGQNSPDLLYINLKIMNYLECRTAAQPATSTIPIESSHICGLNEDGKSFCNQDSGGPLVANGKQLGIVSWSWECAGGYADVYTKVSFYKNWIDNHS